MAYTVKKLAAMSGVSVRTLHFYDEVGLLKPAYVGANGYRFYEEAQLLTLQQILFYRELGFELKQIKRILGRNNGAIVFDYCNLPHILRHPGSRAQSLALGSKLTDLAEIAGALQFALQAIRSRSAERMRRFRRNSVKARTGKVTAGV